MIKIDELVEEAKNGSKEAFSRLIIDIENYLYKIARTKLHNEEDIQDAIQNTILNAYLNIDKLRDNHFFKTWITRILINECNKIYKYSKKNTDLFEKYINVTGSLGPVESISFDEIIEILDESTKRIFELYYKENLSIKEISKKMNIGESTIRSVLSRGRKKIKTKLSHSSIIILILCLFITTGVIAISIVNYIQSLFDTKNVGANNDGILSAIEDSAWYQHVDMDYINLNNEYQLKVEYILVDEMNFYFVVDIHSTEDLSKMSNFSINDLYISTENNDIICDRGNILNTQSQRYIGDKLIYKDKSNMKSLIFMYTDEFHLSEKLNINFSKLTFYTKKKQKIINANANLQIQLSQKFGERKSVIYNSYNTQIKKSLITTTGFYSIIQTTKHEILDINLIDENGNKYKCTSYMLSSNNNEDFLEYIVICNIRDTNNKILHLQILNEEFELIKKD